jgi:hypothetical protein
MGQPLPHSTGEIHPLARLSSLEARVDQLEKRILELDSARVTARSTAAPSGAPTLEVVSIDARITEANDVWSRFSWKLVVRNRSTSPCIYQATIEFSDADGFMVNQSPQSPSQIGPQSEVTASGFELIDASVAPNIRSVGATLEAV